MNDKDQKLLWEAYLAEDETTSTGKDIIDTLERSADYDIVEDKREGNVRKVTFGHIQKAITLEVLSAGETVAFVQLKWMTPDSEFPRNRDYGPDKIAKGPVTIMVDLQDIEKQSIDRV